MTRYSSSPLTLAVCSLFAVGGCQDKKLVQENEQIKNRVDEATKANDALMKKVLP
jgi:hypothetical protein